LFGGLRDATSLPGALVRGAEAMAIKTNPGNFFEDFRTGATLVHAVPRTITEGDCALYIGLTGDRYPLHCSDAFARSLGYERAPVNDLLVFHVVFGKTVNDVSLNAVANLGYAGLRFLAPVYPGDTLRSVSEVIGKKENASGQNGIVWVRTAGENQRGERVLEYYRWVMVNKRDPSTPTGADDRPKMPPQVEPSQLVVAPCLDLARYESWPAGGRAFLEDYEPGERIHHVDGMTIEESEHAIATRLYQNTAKVHFDAYAAKNTRFGKRLIYGGHVISLARALSFNGLENALAILAFNAGAHANPTFAGDTLYAYSEVLARADVPGCSDAGALRMRLVAVKNADPAREEVPLKVTSAGKDSYHANVVLDLDLWLLMPKRARG
jgi:2-methylfumaryl-CoA hydratase